MADREVNLPLTHGPLSITIAFYKAEAELWRCGGTPAFLTMLAITAENKLNDAGGIGPYEFQVIGKHDGVMSAYVFQGRELS